MSEDVKREAKDPTTLPQDIYNLLENLEGHEASEENVKEAGELFMQLLRNRLTYREDKKELYFSSIGKPDRQIWYDINDSEGAETLTGKNLFKFLYGDVIEIVLLFLAKESGHTVEDTQARVEVDGVRGKIDAKIDGVLVDVKSASSYAFEKFKSGGYLFDDPFGYVSQLSGYANALGENRAGFLVADKVHGDICYVEFDNAYIEGNKPEDRIGHLKEVLAQPVPPSRCYSDVADGKSGNRKLGIGCSYCRHKEKCWADANDGQGLRKFFYSGGPRWLTKVAKEPRVDES